MKTVISHSLFGTHPRYWTNIPYLIVSHNLTYGKHFSNCVSRFYVEEAMLNEVPAVSIIAYLAQRCKTVELVVQPYCSEQTRGTMWRMRPLWEADTEFLFCRDTDAVTTSDELSAAIHFSRASNSLYCSIRSYALHTTALMAGLCGFNSAAFRTLPALHIKNYEDYEQFGCTKIHRRNGEWGCDQELLSAVFIARNSPVSDWSRTYDYPMRTAPVTLANYSPVCVLPDQYRNIAIEGVAVDILARNDSKISFEGQPHTVTIEDTRWIIRHNDEVASLIRTFMLDHPNVRESYQLAVEDCV